MDAWGRRRWLPRPFMAAAGVALLAGVWAGVARMGWFTPAPPDLPGRHGALMVSGFLGTLIALERAVGLGGGWTWAAPALSTAGAVALAAGAPPAWAHTAFVAAAAALAAVYVAVFRLQPALHTAVMGGGALLWLAGNLLWGSGRPVADIVPWWAGYLVLTIVGERLELNRLLAPSPWQVAALVGALGVFAAGLALDLAAIPWGPAAGAGRRLAGLGLLAMGAWLLRFDIARRTVREPGVHRFTGLALLAGHAWLAAGGALWAVFGSERAGAYHDAMLHAVFLGFVMSMIFGHAPIILPAVLGRPMSYRPAFYGHLALLHLSLVLRLTGDLLLLPGAVRWGGLLNAAAVVLFLLNSAAALRAARSA